MAKSKLLKVSYEDAKNAIRLTTYADTLVLNEREPEKPVLAGIRYGGDPEPVRAMCDAIYGGGGILVETVDGPRKIATLPKQYKRQLGKDGVYAEAMITVVDDADSAGGRKKKAKDGKDDGGQESPADDVPDEDAPQEEIDLPPRTLYFYCPADDRTRLFEDIDQKVSVPLIPEFRDYFLDALQKKGILYPLTVWSCRNNAIAIPGAKAGEAEAFAEIESVTQYLRGFGVTMANKIKDRFIPLFDPAAEPLSDEVKAVNANILAHTGYALYDAQLACVEALKRKILHREPAIIVAECGSGKTKIGAAALYAAHLSAGKKKSFNIVMCPSHVTDKWVREVEETIPNSIARVIRGISDFRFFHSIYEQGSRTAFAIISKEKARDGYMKAPSVRFNKRRRAFLCPHCYEPIEMDVVRDGSKYRVLANAEFFLNENSKNHKCEVCGEVLWEPLLPPDEKRDIREKQKVNEWVRIGEYGFVHRLFVHRHLGERKVYKDPKLLRKIEEVIGHPDLPMTARAAYRAFPLSTYINHYMAGKIDGFCADELHQFAQNSGQGDAMGEIAAVAENVIGMTATLINGYSSGIFHLLWRLFARFMVMDHQDHDDPRKFDREYGVLESKYEVVGNEDEGYNANRRTAKRKTKEKLLPGVSPLVYSRFLLEHAVFLSLMDMGKNLPEYEEFPIPLDMPKLIAEEYSRLQTQVSKLLKDNPKMAAKIMSACMRTLTFYPDQPYGQPGIEDPFTDGHFILVPKDTAAFEDSQPKDLKLMELMERKVKAGERVLIYTSWVKLDTQDKLKKLLTNAGYRTAVLSQNVAPAKRESWVEKRVSEGVQVLITNPSLVETGLDLNDFTTLVYYNIGYNLFTLRQSSRRSWRINQTAPRIEVYFFVYKETIQERALSLMASKMAAAGLIEGQVTDEGLAAMSDCKDLTSQLAKELTMGIRAEVEDLSAVFKRMAILKTDEEKQEFAQKRAVRPHITTQADQITLADASAQVSAESAQTTQPAQEAVSIASPPQAAEPAAVMSATPKAATGTPAERPAAPGGSQRRPSTPPPLKAPVSEYVFMAPARKKSKETTQVEGQFSFFDKPA